ILVPQKINPEEIEKQLQKMPEGTRAEIYYKITLELAANKVDEAIRLFEILRKETPADVEVVRSLAQMYMSPKINKKDQAIKVADEAIAKEPDNLSLQIVRAKIDGDEKKVVDLTRKAIEGIKDPFSREMRLFEFCTGQNDQAEALKHLDAAE